jgi:hypothetical protein
MKQHNGHRSWGAWNVHLWISNEEFLYQAAMNCLQAALLKRQASKSLFIQRKSLGRLAVHDMIKYLPPKTPDGARNTVMAVRLALDLLAEGMDTKKTS